MWRRKYKSELPVKECAYCKSRNLQLNSYCENWAGICDYFVICLECDSGGKINKLKNRVEWE